MAGKVPKEVQVRRAAEMMIMIMWEHAPVQRRIELLRDDEQLKKFLVAVATVEEAGRDIGPLMDEMRDFRREHTIRSK